MKSTVIRIIAAIMALVMVASCFAGCEKKPDDQGVTKPSKVEGPANNDVDNDVNVDDTTTTTTTTTEAYPVSSSVSAVAIEPNFYFSIDDREFKVADLFESLILFTEYSDGSITEEEISFETENEPTTKPETKTVPSVSPASTSEIIEI